LSNTDNVTPTEWAGLLTYVNDNHEVACHTRNHTPLTDLSALDLTVSGTNPSLVLAITDTDDDSGNWSGTIEIYENSVQIGDTIDIAGTTRMDTVATAISNIDGAGGWEATVTGDTASHAVCLTPGTYTANGAIDLDEENFWFVEIAESKKDIEDGLDREAISFVHPGNVTSEDVRNYLKDDTTIYPGHFARAGTTPFKIVRSDFNGDSDLSSIDLSNIYGHHINQIIETTGGSNHKKYTNVQGVYSAWSGVVQMPYSHGATEWTLDEWEDYIDRNVNISGMSILTMAQIYNRITGSGLWVNSSGTTWTRTFTDRSDYHIGKNSVCVNSGINVSALYGLNDYYGKKLYNQYNLGIDQYTGTPLDSKRVYNLIEFINIK